MQSSRDRGAGARLGARGEGWQGEPEHAKAMRSSRTRAPESASTPPEVGRRCSSRGKDDAERAPLSLLALELDASAVALDGPERDGQAEPGASLVARSSAVDAVEALEDPREVGLGDSRALVRDLDHRAGVAAPSDVDGDDRAPWRVLDGVVGQVDEGLAQEEGVGREPEAGVPPDLDPLVPLLGEDLEERHGALHQLEQAQILAMEALAGVGRERGTAGRRPGATGGRPLRACCRWSRGSAPDPGRSWRATSPTARMAVRGVRSSWEASAVKRRSWANGVLDPGQGQVEDAGQVAQLVFRVLDGQALAQVVHGQALGLTRQAIEGRQGAAGQPVASESRRSPRRPGGRAGCRGAADATRDAGPPRSGPPGGRRARPPIRCDAAADANRRAVAQDGGRSARAPGAPIGGPPSSSWPRRGLR